VATVMPWAAEALAQYIGQVRPCYEPGGHPALWLTERGGRISPRQVDDPFAAWRAAARLPGELSVHCLRHSYVSHLIEDGVDPRFVQQQARHSRASTTATYTTVGQDARNRMLPGPPTRHPSRRASSSKPERRLTGSMGRTFHSENPGGSASSGFCSWNARAAGRVRIQS
jgi:site-specific recombinase XerD